MPLTIDSDGPRTRAPATGHPRHGGPVVLATYASAALDARAIRLAVETAADMHRPLTVADVVALKPARRGGARTTDAPPPAREADLRAVAALAAEVGVEIRTRRVASLRPVEALLALVEDHRPALVVFGADPARLRRFRTPTRRQFRRYVDALVRAAPCLLWTAADPAMTALAPAAAAPQADGGRPAGPARRATS